VKRASWGVRISTVTVMYCAPRERREGKRGDGGGKGRYFGRYITLSMVMPWKVDGWMGEVD
jgi:hypothetical protein